MVSKIRTIILFEFCGFSIQDFGALVHYSCTKLSNKKSKIPLHNLNYFCNGKLIIDSMLKFIWINRIIQLQVPKTCLDWRDYKFYFYYTCNTFFFRHLLLVLRFFIMPPSHRHPTLPTCSLRSVTNRQAGSSESVNHPPDSPSTKKLKR